MELNCCCASGSRRSCASAAITNALNCADLVAVVVASEYEGRIAASLRRDVEGQPGARVVSASTEQTPWLLHGFAMGSNGAAEAVGAERACRCEPATGPDAAANGCRRTVLVWEETDRYIRECPDHFDQSVSVLCRAISGSAADLGVSFPIHRAVLLGGNALCDHLARVAAQVPDEIRFRYILVQ